MKAVGTLSRTLVLAGAVAASGLLAGCRSESPSAARKDLRVQAAVEPAELAQGEMVTVRIAVEAEPGFSLALPLKPPELPGLKLVALGTEPGGKGMGGARGVWWRFLALEPGSYRIPPQTLAPVRGNSRPLESPALFVEVRPAGAPAPAAELRPVRMPAAAAAIQPRPWLALGALLAALALLLASVLWLRARSRPPAVVEPPPPRDPADVALDRLDSLAPKLLGDRQAVRGVYFAVSEIVRGYVESRFGLNATDLTTEEILHRQSEARDLLPSQRAELVELLSDADRVKFGPSEPGRDEARELLERAVELVAASRPRLPVEAA